MLGLRELVLIALVTLVLYGRSGVLKSERAQTVLPWVSPVRRRPRPGGPSKQVRSRVAGAFLTRGNKLFWALTILAATAVGAWVVTRTMISTGVSH
jgi:hypothetical protein